MSERQGDRRERYRKVRSEFDSLEIEDKALFLLEATVSTVIRGVEEFGRTMSDELEKVFSERAEEPAAEPPGTGSPSEPTPPGSSRGGRTKTTERPNGSTRKGGGETPDPSV